MYNNSRLQTTKLEFPPEPNHAWLPLFEIQLLLPRSLINESKWKSLHIVTLMVQISQVIFIMIEYTMFYFKFQFVHKHKTEGN